MRVWSGSLEVRTGQTEPLGGWTSTSGDKRGCPNRKQRGKTASASHHSVLVQDHQGRGAAGRHEDITGSLGRGSFGARKYGPDSSGKRVRQGVPVAGRGRAGNL